MEIENPVTPETVTTLVGNPITGTFTYTNEANVPVTLFRISADVGNSIVPGTDGGAYYVGGGGGSTVKDIAVFEPQDNQPPASNFSTPFVINATSPIPVLQFPSTAQTISIFTGRVPSTYAGGNIIARLLSSASAITGTVGWDVTFQKIAAGSVMSADSWATAQVVTPVTVPGVLDTAFEQSVTITAGAAGTASLAAGDMFRFRVRRTMDVGLATGDANLYQVYIREV